MGQRTPERSAFRRVGSVCALSLGLLLLAGCPAGDDASETDAATADPAAAPAASANASPIGRTSDRTKPDGRWLLMVIRQQRALPAGIVEIDSAADPPVKLVEQTQSAQTWTIGDATVTDDSVELTIDRPQDPIEMKLTLRDGRLDGTATYGGGNTSDAQLIAWDDSPADSENLYLLPPGYQRMELLASKPESTPEEAIALAAEYEGSPVRRELYRLALQRDLESLRDSQTDEGLLELSEEDEARIVQRLEDYLAESAKWGEPSEARSIVGAVLDLVMAGYRDQELVDRMAARAAELDGRLSVTGEFRRRVAPLIVAVGEGNRIEEAQAFVDEFLPKRPFDDLVFVLRELLVQHTENKEDDLAFYTEVAAMRATPQDLERAAEMFRDVRGTDDGAERFIEDRFEVATTRFAVDPVLDVSTLEVPEGEVRQVPLFEMFTSSNCMPCVATDVGLSALGKAYGDEVIILREHLPLVGDDALATVHGEARGEMYDVKGTPMVFLNGLDVNPKRERGFTAMYGPVPNGPPAYAFFEARLIPELKRTTPIRIDASAGYNDDGILEVDATVTGHPKDHPAVHMILALAEEKIRVGSPNGILVHDMVLRLMLGNPFGIPQSDEGLTASGTVNMQLIRAAVLGYVEKDGAKMLPEIRRKVIEFDDLKLIVFVQDIETKAVLQSAMFDVTGEPPEIPDILIYRDDDPDDPAFKNPNPPQDDRAAGLMPTLDEEVAEALQAFSESQAAGESDPAGESGPQP